MKFNRIGPKHSTRNENSFNRQNHSTLRNVTYPSAKAPDHCSKNPRMADIKITEVLLKFQSKESTPGGSKQGNIAARKIKVIGVVFHISLLINSQIRQHRERKEKKL